MMVPASLSADGKRIVAKVPITRTDIMHACDLMEDVAVAFGFEKIPRVAAPVTCTGALTRTRTRTLPLTLTLTLTLTRHAAAPRGADG